MAKSQWTGPTVTSGPMVSAPGAPDYPYEPGPNIDYQGMAIPDPRFVMNKDNLTRGTVPAHYLGLTTLVTDYVPSASAATPVNISAAANAVSGTAVTLATAAGGISTGVPFYPFGSTTLTTAPITLDFGWGTLNCTASTAAATPSAGTMPFYQLGQWLVVANVGNSGGTTALLAQVTAVGSTTVTLNPAPQATNSAARVGQGNIMTTLNQAPAATAWVPYRAAGPAALLNPLDSLSRGVGIAGSTSATGGAFLVRGWDVYGQPVSETITAAAGAGPTYGVKTYKHIRDVTPQFSDAHTYSVGTSDVFGFNLRADRWEYTMVFFAGAVVAASTGFTAPDMTNPATSSTGEVRGTMQFAGRGPLGSGSGSNSADGTRRLVMAVSPSIYNIPAATPTNPAAMYGVTQA